MRGDPQKEKAAEFRGAQPVKEQTWKINSKLLMTNVRELM